MTRSSLNSRSLDLLSPSEPAFYEELLRLGFLREESLKYGEIQLVEVADGAPRIGRSATYELRHWDREHGGDLRIRVAVGKSAAGLRRELRFFASIEQTAARQELLPWLIQPLEAPSQRDSAAEDEVLVAAYPLRRELRSLWGEVAAVDLRRGAASLGAALGKLHRTPSEAPDSAIGPAPKIFSLDRPTLDTLRDLSPRREAILRRVAESEALGRALVDARAAWMQEESPRLIHGALRERNVRVAPGGERARIIDWDDFCFGMPSWDVGAILACFVRYWLHSRPGPDSYEVFRRSFEKDFRIAVRSFFESYRIPHPMPLLREGDLLRAIALNLLQGVWDDDRDGDDELPWRSRRRLAVAEALLRDAGVALTIFGPWSEA